MVATHMAPSASNATVPPRKSTLTTTPIKLVSHTQLSSSEQEALPYPSQLTDTEDPDCDAEHGRPPAGRSPPQPPGALMR
jgi:hypothetical protein